MNLPLFVRRFQYEPAPMLRIVVGDGSTGGQHAFLDFRYVFSGRSEIKQSHGKIVYLICGDDVAFSHLHKFHETAPQNTGTSITICVTG